MVTDGANLGDQRLPCSCEVQQLCLARTATEGLSAVSVICFLEQLCQIGDEVIVVLRLLLLGIENFDLFYEILFARDLRDS